MNLANRISKLPPYLFFEISRKIMEKRAAGVDVISLGIGDPDLPTPQYILDSMWEASQVPANHRYPESDSLPEFRQAVAEWYERRFGVVFDPDKEVLGLIGSKDGIGHIALCFIDPGDIAIVPDPGYPVYSVGTMFAGGESYYVPVVEDSGYLIDYDAIPEDVARKAKVLWINYPNNPTAATAEVDFFERTVAWAKKYDVAVLHDAPYTEVAFDGYRPASFMQAKGARDVGIEFHSLSKTFNMTGWRIGMAVGNAEIINALLRVKTNLDSGIPQAIQYMGMTALRGSDESSKHSSAVLQHRRDRVVTVLQKLGFPLQVPKASFFVWAKIPTDELSIPFAARLLDDTGVVVTPGLSYGPNGEGYIRIALTTPDDRIEEAMRRLENWQVK